jgi:hypothetical protein
MAEHIVEEKQILRFVNTGFRVAYETGTALNARASENYLAISSKSVEIFWAEIYWGRFFFRAESSLIQSSCRSYTREMSCRSCMYL